MNVDIKKDTIIQKSENFISTEMDGETIMMSIEKGNYYSISSEGTCIWKHLDHPQSVVVLCEKLIKEFDVPLNQCIKDTIEFVTELCEQNIIVIKEK